MSFKLYCPDHTIFIFEIFDKDMVVDELLARYAIPFNCIRNGYRIIPLMNSKLEIIDFSYLFVNITIKDL